MLNCCVSQRVDAFLRVADHVPRQNGVRYFAERVIKRQRFGLKYVQCDFEVRTREGQLEKSRFVHYCSARCIDQNCIGLQQVEPRTVEQTSSFVIETNVYADDIARS